MLTYTIDLTPFIQLSDRQFAQLCDNHPDIKFERNARGELIVMPPTGGETGNRNIELSADFVVWNRRTKLGYLFDSSTCFKLPNGGNRSPDLSWIRRDRWEALSPGDRETFPPIAPDFVLELKSPSDDIKTLREKMAEYLDAGVTLGWLIDRQAQTVEIYRQGREAEWRDRPVTLDGETVLPGFELDLNIVW
ncbi:Uma2 family endonuclease [Baaleninema simplex]|uniref:Uma2 family endonuclease n=1 Tax=Baaleninema simplex TaxID=2862350 RepID=UPI0003450270|nr:Uma2 family endonuclease [Baaleninema simplex]